MKHEMPVITEEQRQALIADCKAGIAHIEKMLPCWAKTTYTLPYLQKQLQLKKIALASLEAGPADTIIDADETPASLGVTKLSEQVSCSWEIGTKFYTAPPVPVMQAVDIGESMVMSRGFVIKAIRAAGGEVKND